MPNVQCCCNEVRFLQIRYVYIANFNFDNILFATIELEIKYIYLQIDIIVRINRRHRLLIDFSPTSSPSASRLPPNLAKTRSRLLCSTPRPSSLHPFTLPSQPAATKQPPAMHRGTVHTSNEKVVPEVECAVVEAAAGLGG